MLPELDKYVPRSVSGYYYEPFVGAGALLFHRQYKRARINDLNDQLILTYKVVRDNVSELIEQLEGYKEKDCSDFYYMIRGQDRETNEFKKMSDVEKAARMIYLNKTCYNGLYRVNSQGLFNTPYGRYKNPAICEKEVLRAVSAYLNDIELDIRNEDFEDAVSDAEKGDFVYFDPPYHTSDTNFTGYLRDRFDEEEQRRLRDCVVNLTDKKVKCLVSNSNTQFVQELYSSEHCSKFKIEIVSATRMINSDATGRGRVEEVLVRNWK